VTDNNWLCIDCGATLGAVVGGEFSPDESVPCANIRTRGPNLVITCPHCGTVKTWYTADPIVRSQYQMLDALATALTKRVLSQLSEGLLKPPHE